MPPIRAHFEELLELHKHNVRATKAVREMTKDGNNDVTLKEDNDDVVWLDCTAGPRPLYYRYALSQGYVVKPKKDGLDVRPVNPDLPAAEQKRLVSLRTYVRIWKRDYPQLKVSKAHEDICALCVKFRNRHQSLAIHNTCPVATTTLDEWEDEDIFGVLADGDTITNGPLRRGSSKRKSRQWAPGI